MQDAGGLYRHGMELWAKGRYLEGDTLLHQAKAAGSADAAWQLGYLVPLLNHNRGDDPRSMYEFSQDLLRYTALERFEYCKRAAKLGYLYAQRDLARAYEYGYHARITVSPSPPDPTALHTIDRDIEACGFWSKIAAERGDSKAQDLHALYCYKIGDRAEGAFWLWKSYRGSSFVHIMGDFVCFITRTVVWDDRVVTDASRLQELFQFGRMVLLDNTTQLRISAQSHRKLDFSHCNRIYQQSSSRARAAALMCMWMRLVHKDICKRIAWMVWKSRSDPETWNVEL